MEAKRSSQKKREHKNYLFNENSVNPQINWRYWTIIEMQFDTKSKTALGSTFEALAKLLIFKCLDFFPSIYVWKVHKGELPCFFSSLSNKGVMPNIESPKTGRNDFWNMLNDKNNNFHATLILTLWKRMWSSILPQIYKENICLHKSSSFERGSKVKTAPNWPVEHKGSCWVKPMDCKLPPSKEKEWHNLSPRQNKKL